MSSVAPPASRKSRAPAAIPTAATAQISAAVPEDQPAADEANAGDDLRRDARRVTTGNHERTGGGEECRPNADDRIGVQARLVAA
jgi:hypothetical protein